MGSGAWSDYQAKLLLGAARRTTTAWCADAVKMCQVLDKRMKSEKGLDGVGELKLLLVRLGGGAHMRKIRGSWWRVATTRTPSPRWWTRHGGDPGGFSSVFNDREKLAFLRRLALERGLIVLTDSDGAGFVLRNYLKGALPKDRVKQAYIPDVAGEGAP